MILTASIPVIDAQTGEEISRGDVPERAVAVQATRPREFPGGTFGLVVRARAALPARRARATTISS